MFHPNRMKSQKNMDVFIYIKFKTCETKQPFLYGYNYGRIKKEMINAKFSMELLLKDEEMGRGPQETSREDKIYFVLKVHDGILEFCLYDCMHLSKHMKLYTQKGTFCSM